MTAFQMIVIGLGVLLGIGTFGGDLKSILASILNFFKKDKAAPDAPEAETENSLAEVVICWERLQEELKGRGLNKAASELSKIFPLFVEAVQEETETKVKKKGA